MILTLLVGLALTATAVALVARTFLLTRLRATAQQLRARHLTDIRAPMLFVQGSRDAFGSPGELQPILTRLEAPAELHVVDGGDHSFKVPKRAGIAQEDVYEAVLDRIGRWLRETLVGP